MELETFADEFEALAAFEGGILLAQVARESARCRTRCTRLSTTADVRYDARRRSLLTRGPSVPRRNRRAELGPGSHRGEARQVRRRFRGVLCKPQLPSDNPETTRFTAGTAIL
jgi:hypothetical protein